MIKIYKEIPYILVLSAFGPYISLSAGVRLEHLVIYSLFFLVSLFYLTQRNVSFIKPLSLILFFWLLSFFTFLVRTVMDTEKSTLFKILADTENFFQPIALMFLFFGCLYKFSAENAKARILKTSKLLSKILSINTVWILIGFFIDTTAINVHFWGGTDSVASNAATMGRYSGIFNQPSEAGIMYSLGLISWLYFAENQKKVKFTHVISLVLMVLGGLFTVSKIFVIGGLLVFAIGILFAKKVRKQMIKLSIYISVIGISSYYYFFKTWDGQAYLFRLFTNPQQLDFLNLITSGRFGGGNQQASLFESVWNQHPLIGLGFGKLSVADNAYFQFFGIGGLIGMLLFIVILFIFAALCINFLRRFGLNSETKFFLSIFILILGGNMGVPTFTLNRVSVVLWVFICLLIQFYFFSFNKKASETKVVAA